MKDLFILYDDLLFAVGSYVAGVIPVARIAGFTRILWFASRGNIFVRHFEIQEPLKDPATVRSCSIMKYLIRILMVFSYRVVNRSDRINSISFSFSYIIFKKSYFSSTSVPRNSKFCLFSVARVFLKFIFYSICIY